ncbi:nuclease-related domain-containing protein [Clostridium thermobutyricum]|uniref:nuclease-related domain-containing protein n=1 Tax=Clostridium thermobutyricum TaxID=29372 RepID=UPI0018AC8987|nr:nuclease-related domain-containing protein [Clostridium thermobutyricum]
MWLTNDNAIKYLDKVHSNLVIVNEVINKSIEDKVFYNGVPQYINFSIEALFNKIEEDTKSANNELKILSLGMGGEELVNKIINTHKYIENLPNLIIKDNDGQRVECDNILITDKGIFILEVKNYGSSGNFTLKIDTSGRWERIYKSKAYVMDSPVAQNSRHIGIIKNILFDNNISVPVYGIIVISNDTVDIINNSNSIVVRAGSLMDTINNLKGEVLLNIDERKNIYNLFNSMREEEVKHSFKNYNLYNDYLNDILSLINLNNEYRENVVKLYNEVFPDNN